MTVTNSRIGVSMPMLNQPYEKYPQFANLADEAGFDSVWDYEFYRNPFITHALTAQVTKNIKLCTGIAAAAARTPHEMAHAAADVDELSNGRMILGMSIGGADWAEHYNGVEINSPLPRMRNYIELVRAHWKHHHTGEPFEINGRFYSAKTPPFNAFGIRQQLARPEIPIYLASLKPKMLQLAGEVANGALGFLTTPKFIQEQILPNIAIGAEKSGRKASDIDVAALVLCSIHNDKKIAQRIARINVGMYVAYPIGAPMVETMGLTEDRNAVLQKLMTEGPMALKNTTSDALVKAFSITGTPDEAREQLAAYDGVLPHIILHTPYVPPIQQAESEAAFRNMVATFARK